jgi:hypothetical protein
MGGRGHHDDDDDDDKVWSQSLKTPKNPNDLFFDEMVRI